MGYMLHHAIVVTTCFEADLKLAHKTAEEFGCKPTPMTPPTNPNGYVSFMIPPDGSKEGWERSDVGESFRDTFIVWLRDQSYDDGSSTYAWFEASYSSDDQESKVTRHQWDKHAKKAD